MKKFYTNSEQGSLINTYNFHTKWYDNKYITESDLKTMHTVLRNNNLHDYDYDWIKDNIIGNFTYSKGAFYFDDEHDALLFKLKFSV